MARLPTIRKRQDFSRLYASGARRRSPEMTLVFFRTEGLAMTRVAFVASGRCGGAVERNRVRRRLREAYRRLAARICPGAHLAIIAHPPAVDADYWALTQTLERLLQGAGLLCPAHEEGGPCESS